MTRSFWAAPAVATIAGLVLLLAAAAAWIAGEDAREVGGVLVTEPVATSGTQFAPTAVVFGLAGLLGGVGLGALRGPARRVAGVGVAGVALGSIAVLAVGIGRAMDAEGVLTPAPYFALAAAAGLLVSGVAALRAPARPPDRSRYRVGEEHAGDDEWTLAGGGEEPPP
jgi:hypothetical protein